MQKLLFLLLVTAYSLKAQEISLTDIINYVRVHHPHYKALEEESLALEAKINSEYAREMSTLSLTGANADPDTGKSGSEYSASLRLPIDIANTRGLNLESGEMENEAILLQKQKALFAFGNRIRNLYHQSCLDQENVHLHQKALDAFERLYEKKRIAYKYHEISKKELLQIELERNMLIQKVEALKEGYKTSKSALLNLADIPKTEKKELVCRDVFPVVAAIEIENQPFLLSKLAYEKEREALDKKYTRYDRFLEPIALSLNYDDELDTKRYGAGVEIPLGFTSSKNEQKRIYLLRQKEVLKRHYQAWLLESMAKKERLFAELKSNYSQITALTNNKDRYTRELMPLIEKSFQMGESSVIEYLLGRQKLLDISVALLQSKKRYYQRLFDLYTLMETEK